MPGPKPLTVGTRVRMRWTPFHMETGIVVDKFGTNTVHWDDGQTDRLCIKDLIKV